MKILYFSDSHFQAEPPFFRDETPEEFRNIQLKSLSIVFNLAKRLKCNLLIFGGDFFDRFSVPISLFFPFLYLFKKFKEENPHIQFLATIGNHDIYASNLNSLKSSFLGLLSLFKLIELKRTFKIEGLTFHFTHFHRNLKVEEFQNISADIVCCHAPLSPIPLPFPHIRLSEIKTKAKIMLCSHLHKRFCEEDRGIFFINPGPLISTQEDLGESRGVYLINLANKLSFNFIPIEKDFKRRVYSLEDKTNEGDRYDFPFPDMKFPSLNIMDLLKKAADTNLSKRAKDYFFLKLSSLLERG